MDHSPSDETRTERPGTDVEDVLSQLETLEQTVDSAEERREVHRAIQLVDRLPNAGVTDRIRKFTRRDIAEVFVGSILISLPLLVEDGVYDIADHFVEFLVAGVPVFFLANALFVVVLTAGLLYYAEFRDVAVHRPIFGIIPRRLLAVLVVSFFTASLTMTLWGRVDNWEDPMVALARISVIWAAGAFGGALGDILPGESKGEDITDEFDALGESLGFGDD